MSRKKKPFPKTLKIKLPVFVEVVRDSDDQFQTHARINDCDELQNWSQKEQKRVEKQLTSWEEGLGQVVWIEAEVPVPQPPDVTPKTVKGKVAKKKKKR